MKKITLLWLAIVAIALASCGHSSFRSNPKPDNLIPEDTMVVMIAEQLIYESTLDFVKQEIEREDTTLCQQVNRMVEGEPITIDSIRMGSTYVMSKLSMDYYGSWLNKRGYTSKQYEQSLIYYFNTTETTRHIMTRVKDYITKNYNNNFSPFTPQPTNPHYQHD